MSTEESLRNNTRAHEVVAELQERGLLALDGDSHETFLVLKRAFDDARKDARRRVRAHIADRLVEIKTAVSRQRYDSASAGIEAVLRETSMNSEGSAGLGAPGGLGGSAGLGAPGGLGGRSPPSDGAGEDTACDSTEEDAAAPE